MKNAIVLSNVEKLIVEVLPSAISQKQTALVAAAAITAVSDTKSQALAVNALKELQGLTKAVENSRMSVKAPVLEIGRKIDSLAHGYSLELELEGARIKKLIADYQNEQERIRQAAERARLEELQRLEREVVAVKAKEEEAKAEAARLEAEKQKAWEAEFMAETDKQIEDASRAQAALMAQEAEADRQRQEQAAKAQLLAAQQKAVASAVIPTAHKPSGMSVQEKWRFEVVNLGVLYQHNAELVRMEANAAAINEQLRLGVREIPGLRIWSEKSVGVRS
jgi:hypothetical protein